MLSSPHSRRSPIGSIAKVIHRNGNNSMIFSRNDSRENTKLSILSHAWNAKIPTKFCSIVISRKWNKFFFFLPPIYTSDDIITLVSSDFTETPSMWRVQISRTCYGTASVVSVSCKELKPFACLVLQTLNEWLSEYLGLSFQIAYFLLYKTQNYFSHFYLILYAHSNDQWFSSKQLS